MKINYPAFIYNFKKTEFLLFRCMTFFRIFKYGFKYGTVFKYGFNVGISDFHLKNDFLLNFFFFWGGGRAEDAPGSKIKNNFIYCL